MRGKFNEKGFIKGVIYLLIFSLLVFIGLSFAMPYYRYYAFKTQAEGYLKTEVPPQLIRDRIIETARELNVPVLEENISLTNYEKSLALNVFWFEKVNLFGYYQKKLDFVIEAKN